MCAPSSVTDSRYETQNYVVNLLEFENVTKINKVIVDRTEINF